MPHVLNFDDAGWALTDLASLEWDNPLSLWPQIMLIHMLVCARAWDLNFQILQFTVI